MKKILIFLIILAVLCCGFFVFMHVFKSNVYKDGEEFRDFANNSINEKELFKKNTNTYVEYEYDETFSYAVRKDTYSGEEISEFRDSKVTEIVNDCKLQTVLEERKRYEQNEEGYYKPLEHACIIDTSVQDSGNGADSLVIYTRVYMQEDRDMVLQNSNVRTFLFSQETGKEIKPVQALNVNYKAKAHNYTKDYFSKNFSENKLNSNWEQYIEENDENFNNLLMTGNSIIFFFDEGTIQDESNGVMTAKIPYKYMQSAIRPVVVDRYIDPNKPMVALTYDDGPGGESESMILKYLEDHDCVATFFYQGYRVDKFQENAKKAVEIGCEIGNHSWNHPQLSLLSKAKIASQIDRTNDAISDVTGITPELIRPPYGDFNKKVTSVVKSKGMSEVLWTVDTLDWKTRDANKIYKSVKRIKKLDGKIILMHSIYKDTAKATKKIIPYLEKKGYQIVTVSELIKYKTGSSPKPGEVYRKLN